MCTDVEIRRKGMRSVYADTVRDLAVYFKVIVPVARGARIYRRASHCLCPIDLIASAEASGYRIIDEPGFCPDVIVEKKEAAGSARQGALRTRVAAQGLFSGRAKDARAKGK